MAHMLCPTVDFKACREVLQGDIGMLGLHTLNPKP